MVRRNVNWLFNVEVTFSVYGLSSASVFNFDWLGDWFLVMSLFHSVLPFNFNLFFFIMRLNKVSGDVNISWNGDISYSVLVSDFSWMVDSRESPLNILRRLDLNLFSVVNNSRFDESSSVDLVSFNINSSVNRSSLILNSFGSVLLYKLILSFNVNWVKSFSDSVYIRLYYDLLSCRFYNGVSNVSGWTYYSFSDYFRFLNHAVYDGLRLRVNFLDWYIIKAQVQLISLVAVYGQC